MTDQPMAPAWVAALTPTGELTFRDVSTLLGPSRRELLVRLRDRVDHVDHIRVHSPAGWLLVYFHDARRSVRPSPINPHARELLRSHLGVDIGTYHGTFLIIGEHDDRETGLTEQQESFLQDLLTQDRTGHQTPASSTANRT